VKTLVTGGAGYIGSHVARQLAEAGHDVVVLDDLSTGHRWAVLHGELVVGDLGDPETLDGLFAAHRFDAVLHFAARIVVPESVRDPLKYFGNNTRNTLGLLERCARDGVERFVFSSTAAVYGIPEGGMADEDAPLAPISPYGASKMMSERMLIDLAAASPLRYAILRYFNVAGADPESRIGQATPGATHLVKVACEAALGRRPAMTVYGDDYDTPDGTCIRDYIHVEDLADAHLRALDHLAGDGPSRILNCGYGRGHSVREVVEAVRRVSGDDFSVEAGPRRPGDPPRLVARSERIRDELGWEPRYDDLDLIVRTALDFEAALASRTRTEVGR
jgi:UDP-glucose 4-epimerase